MESVPVVRLIVSNLLVTNAEQPLVGVMWLNSVPVLLLLAPRKAFDRVLLFAVPPPAIVMLKKLAVGHTQTALLTQKNLQPTSAERQVVLVMFRNRALARQTTARPMCLKLQLTSAVTPQVFVTSMSTALAQQLHVRLIFSSQAAMCAATLLKPLTEARAILLNIAQALVRTALLTVIYPKAVCVVATQTNVTCLRSVQVAGLFAPLINAKTKPMR